MSERRRGRPCVDEREAEDERLVACYAEHLDARGHRTRPREAYLRAVQHWLHWRATASKTVGLDRRGVERFLDEHLPRCGCINYGCKDLKTVRAALNQLLIMLGDDRSGLIRDRATSPAIEASITAFDGYLSSVCALAASTRQQRRAFVQRFLWWRFADQALEVEALAGTDFMEFMAGRLDRLRPGSLRGVVVALRSYLRFLRFNGYATPSLDGALLRPANYRLAELPPCLDEASLERFWAAFERSSALGKRDYAIARCLGDLGLRGAEVADLTLESVDWHTYRVRLSASKTRREDILPLPRVTASAIADYLHNGRPATDSRALFVHHRAPLGNAVHATTVRAVVRRAFHRSGLAFTGPHALRRTLASRLLDGGAPLKHIADVLRHRSLDTTGLYTKVDRSGLRTAALPWPESAP